MSAIFRAYNNWLADPRNARRAAIRGLPHRSRQLKGIAMINPNDVQDGPFWAVAESLEIPLSLHTATRRQGRIRGSVPGRSATIAAARPRRYIRHFRCAT